MDPASDAIPTLPETAGDLAAVPGGGVLGRFEIERVLGMGGMGVVFVARDPVLDRRVAVKLVRLAGDAPETLVARARLLREAQAMARVTHPNVVTVYEAGLIDRGVYIAMELVEGMTLREWTRRARPWREVVDVFLAAGRGLAAAHASGLVHRDFKPANVFVDDSGRVKVGDFGLVGSGEPADAAQGPRPDSAIQDATAGMVGGTPAYMAPEQHAGARVDARADQYAYCVSLHEALTGRRPTEATPGRPLARRLRRIIARGTRREPDARFSSMPALIAALERARHGPRGARFALAAAAVAAAVAAAFWIGGRGPTPREQAEAACRADPALLGDAWTAARRDALTAALLATRVPYASDTAARCVAIYDAYAASWQAARTEACRATAVRREQSEALLDRRMQCLARRRGALAALVAAQTDHPDAITMSTAISVASQLPAIDDCARADQLSTVVALPADRVERARIERGQAAVDEIKALSQLARLTRARELADRTAAELAGATYSPLLADLADARGWIAYREGGYPDATAAFDRSLTLAVAAHDAVREERATRRLYDTARLAGADRAELARLRRGEELALERAGHPRDGEAAYRNAVVLEERNRSLEVAERLARAAVREIPVEITWQHGVALEQHAMVLSSMFRDAEALDTARAALAYWEHMLGPTHPKLARALEVIAEVGTHQGQLDDAEAAARRALALRIGAEGADSPNLAPTYEQLAGITAGRRDVPATRRVVDEYLRVCGSVKDTDPINWGNCLAQGGDALVHAGAVESGIEILRRAIAQCDASHDVNDGAIARYNLGRALTSLGGRDTAREALALCTVAEGPLVARFGGPATAMLGQCRGDALLAAGRTREGVAVLERTLAALVAAKADGDELAEARFGLARGRWVLGDHAAAVALADQAAGGWSAPRFSAERARIDAWRAAVHAMPAAPAPSR